MRIKFDVLFFCNHKTNVSSSTMLTTRATFARLSKRAFKNAAKTNAFFSTSSLLQKAGLPSQQRQSTPTLLRTSQSTSIPGMPRSILFLPYSYPSL